jgi:phthiocerol/phenolphthiocerol synthesis type-I polyketide synthase E
MKENEPMESRENTGADHSTMVAIIGMAGRFPRSNNIAEYWKNLEDGVECIKFYDDQELIDAGVNPETLKNPDYVKARGDVDNVDMFDAEFFGINPREAEITDPQHRMLLECAWEAMEQAGYDSSKYDGLVGIFAGKSLDYYLLLNVYPRIRKKIYAGSLQAAIGNDKDSLTTTISYRLNLTGPAITVQTSSSTALVSVCVACQSLLTYQCDLALAGGITAGPPLKSGYLYEEGGIWSQDGHCRAFDGKSKGFVPGSGMGLVVLKRLEDALADGDTIWALIRGFAVNNDGYSKVSYSAPSVDAQSRVVAEALAVADVHPETIQYIETHGTGTQLGDPIELTALNQAFRSQTDQIHFCAIGSVKSNIGHLDNAAGAAGLIKTALALKYKKIPASLYFETPNPALDWEKSPFFVNTRLTSWPDNTRSDGTAIPRRAGVTSLGMGGTNAHVILEEAPLPEPGSGSRVWQLLLLSAQTPSALENRTRQLADYLDDPGNRAVDLADIAYTLALGRRDFNQRRFALCPYPGLGETRTTLQQLTPGRVMTSQCETVKRPVVFMFSGQGSQYVDMCRELYDNEPVFRDNIDKGADLLIPLLGVDLRKVIFYTPGEDIEQNAELLNQTRYTQPVLFIIEYAMARWWMALGIEPRGMIGHSIGELAAATIAGCMSLEDALTLVASRGRLMYEQEEGAMVAVGLNEEEVIPWLDNDLALAAVNSPRHCMISGKTAAVRHLEERLSASDSKIFHRRLRTSHAFHSPMMDPILADFTAAAAKIPLNPPQIPFISCVTGTWIRDEEACDPAYWARQLREPVRFSAGIREILGESAPLLLEVGPGSSLCVLAQEHGKDDRGESQNPPLTFSSIRHFKQSEPDLLFLLKTLGNLWLSGVSMDWQCYYHHEKRQRLPLPTYPFERKRYWLPEVKETAAAGELNLEAPGETNGQQENAETMADDRSETAATNNVNDTDGKSFQPRPQLSVPYAPATDDLQKKIVAIWEDILGIRPVGIQDNFFDLGGHSLLATLFLSRVQEDFGLRLDLVTIFENPNIASIAELIKNQEKSPQDMKDIEALLDEIEELSDEDVQAALSQPQATNRE